MNNKCGRQKKGWEGNLRWREGVAICSGAFTRILCNDRNVLYLCYWVQEPLTTCTSHRTLEIWLLQLGTGFLFNVNLTRFM